MDSLRSIFHTCLPWVIKVHIALYGTSLVAFWVAILTPKGGRIHVFFGRLFVWCVYGALALALYPMSYKLVRPFLTDELAGQSLLERASQLSRLHIFLTYGWVLTLASIRQGVRAVQTRHDPAAIRTPFHIALGYLAIAASFALVAAALALQEPFDSLLFMLSPVGCWLGWTMLRFIRHPGREHWWYVHLRSMLTTGILLHVALLAFILMQRNLYPQSLQGLLLFWVVLPVAALICGYLWSRRYVNRLGRLPTADAAVVRNCVTPRETEAAQDFVKTSGQ
jgi:hypothetical protein